MAMQVSALAPVPTDPVDTRFRRIATPIPVPESLPAIERLRAAEPRSMAGLPPVIWQRARGFQIEDPYGNRFIDLTSGAAAANAGHAHPRIVQAVHEQLDRELLFTYAFPSDVRARLIERVAALPPRDLDKAIAFCSGTEANECCLTLMRRHGLSISPEKIGILSFSAPSSAAPWGPDSPAGSRALSTRSGATGCTRRRFRCPAARRREDSMPTWPSTRWTRPRPPASSSSRWRA